MGSTEANGVTVDTRTAEEQRIMGETGASMPMTDTEGIVDEKGRVYTPTNFFTEMTAEQREYILLQLAPIIPIVMEAIEVEDMDEFKKKMNNPEYVVPLLGMLKDGGNRDIRALAALYLPKDDREFRIEDVDARMGLFRKWTLMREWRVFEGFFSGSSGSSRNTSAGSSAGPRKKRVKSGGFNLSR